MSSKVKKKVINFYEYIVSLYTEVEKFEVLVPVCVGTGVCCVVCVWCSGRGTGVTLEWTSFTSYLWPSRQSSLWRHTRESLKR